MFLEIVFDSPVFGWFLNVLCFVHVWRQCASVNASAAMWLKLSLQPRPLLAQPVDMNRGIKRQSVVGKSLTECRRAGEQRPRLQRELEPHGCGGVDTSTLSPNMNKTEHVQNHQNTGE